jgi:sec-independent protein translocase protein TatC
MTQKDFDQMELFDHITELRRRLLIAVIALAVTSLVSFTFAPQIIEILARPIGGIQEMRAIEVTENISVYMRVSLLSGLILAMPVIVLELLLFILPGLRANERRWIFIAVPAATILFAAGVAFAYFVMIPPGVKALLNIIDIPTEIRPSNYIGFVTNLMFWIGLSFETPLLVFVLAKLRIVNAGQLVKQWRIAIVVIAIIAAVATPTPDPINMGLMMLPLTGLYGLSIILAVLAVRSPREKD